METVNAVLQPLLITLIQVLAPVLMVAVLAWVRQLIKDAKLKVDSKTLAIVESLVQSLVVAAEANGLTSAAKKEVLDKRAYVLDRAEAELVKLGIQVDPHLISDLLEKIVYEEFNRYQPDTVS